MNASDNVCPQCGGIQNIWYKVEALTAEQIKAQPVQFTPLPNTNWILCPGHPEPIAKHNGILDQFGSAQIRMREHGVLIQDIIDEVELDAAQALSLLAWLKQEEPTLQKLVEEEKEKTK